MCHLCFWQYNHSFPSKNRKAPPSRLCSTALSEAVCMCLRRCPCVCITFDSQSIRFRAIIELMYLNCGFLCLGCDVNLNSLSRWQKQVYGLCHHQRDATKQHCTATNCCNLALALLCIYSTAFLMLFCFVEVLKVPLFSNILHLPCLSGVFRCKQMPPGRGMFPHEKH